VAAYISRSLLVCVCCTVRKETESGNALSENGVTAPKHVGATLM
jgi:hypothetical protein